MWYLAVFQLIFDIWVIFWAVRLVKAVNENLDLLWKATQSTTDYAQKRVNAVHTRIDNILDGKKAC